ncbi:hypothetical protein M408DRAFT_331887 [Serendipita vermifera MAFF 305830]|uniref:DUF7729 domain-containing protein n=1 Tax=Serendipita vermifera MAFF 305830 TaxID=933852 RepID=A0A0C2WCS9_SERVB|nr:hypothetical protein M408DRAFT_331887 [Serendipita vermifera MAFF 305830]
MSAQGPHTHSTSFPSTIDSHKSSSLAPQPHHRGGAANIMSGTTPPPSPSPFMRSFHASQPPPTRPSSSQNVFSYGTLRRIWKQDRHLRRFFLVTALLILPTLVIAAYFAGATTGSYRSMPDDMHAPTLVRRQTVDGADAPVLSLGSIGNTASTQNPASSTASAESGSSSLSATPTTTLPSVAPSVPDSPVLPTPFVQPFDETLSTDFVSASCQVFFANLTQSLPFRQCRPFSLLLPTSQGFLSAQSNLTLLTSIIYGTCSTTPSKDECVARMDGFATDLRGACSAELEDGHAMAWDALNGMKNYAMMREAACLRNQRTNAYCFAEALAATPPSDVYFYQLPLGTPLPGTTVTTTASQAASTTSASRKAHIRRETLLYPDFIKRAAGEAAKITITPTCSACTQSLMGIYASYATNSSLLINDTYGDAQRAVADSSACGSGYAAAVSAATMQKGVGFVTLAVVAVLTIAVGWGL